MYSGHQVATTTINQLPQDIQKLIFSFLTNHDPTQASRDILKLRRLSKEWNQIVMSYLRSLWNTKKTKFWVTEFLEREKSPIFKSALVTFYKIYQNVPFKRLLADKNKYELSRSKAVPLPVIRHLVIRKKIEILAILMERSGIEVPDSLRNFPPLLANNQLQNEFAMLEIERMAGGKNKKKMTAGQKSQIIAAIEECLRSKEHKRGARNSTQQVHQEGFARRKSEKWNRAQRIFQSSGFAAALNDAERC